MIERLITRSQLLLPTRLISLAAFWLSGVRWSPVRLTLIRLFSRAFGITLEESKIDRIEDFPTFNAFFTRELCAGARPLADDPFDLVSPADGCVSQSGIISRGKLLQAKGIDYTVDALIGERNLAAEFTDGEFATVYLAPNNYHRVHMPCDGVLRHMRYIPGRLLSVNQKTATHVPGLFTRNERIVCLFDGPAGQFIMVLVGAMVVGGMETVWSGAITPPHGSRLFSHYPKTGPGSVQLRRGDEMGRFNIGSTVIVLCEPGAYSLDERLDAELPLRMGESIGRIISAND